MSAFSQIVLPPKADIHHGGRHVSEVPASDSRSDATGSFLFDHTLAGKEKLRCWRALVPLHAGVRRRDIGERKTGDTFVVFGQRPQFVLADILVAIFKRLVTD